MGAWQGQHVAFNFPYPSSFCFRSQIVSCHSSSTRSVDPRISLLYNPYAQLPSEDRFCRGSLDCRMQITFSERYRTSTILLTLSMHNPARSEDTQSVIRSCNDRQFGEDFLRRKDFRGNNAPGCWTFLADHGNDALRYIQPCVKGYKKSRLSFVRWVSSPLSVFQPSLCSAAVFYLRDAFNNHPPCPCNCGSGYSNSQPSWKQSLLRPRASQPKLRP